MLTDVTIEPETKSWMWVLGRPCDECGFDTQSFPREELGTVSRRAAEPWAAFLAHPLVRQRPTDDCWSALEYGCHVRDVFRLAIYRVQRMLNEDNPKFENWDQDETAVSERYDLQDPDAVGAELLTAANGLADLYEAVGADQWQRPSLRSDGSPFTVESFGRYLVHDPVHHVVDVRQGFQLLNGVS
jgi:DinB superfamily